MKGKLFLVLVVLSAVIFTVAVQDAMANGGCRSTACHYVQCTETVWGFIAERQNFWNATINYGPCLQTCEDGPCGAMAAFAVADSRGEGVVVVEKITPGERAALHQFAVRLGVATFKDAEKQPNLAQLLAAYRGRFGSGHNVHTMTGDEFNARVADLAKSPPCAAKETKG